jgi:putative membrane protein
MLGQLAAERGARPALRAYGQTLHDDHAQARQQVLPMAQQAGVAITEEPMPEAAKERRKLERLRGRDFDREFARYMVRDHRKDIADFQKQARRGGPAGDLARQTLPVLRKHLQMAERLAQA